MMFNYPPTLPTYACDRLLQIQLLNKKYMTLGAPLYNLSIARQLKHLQPLDLHVQRDVLESVLKQSSI
jgi:hypothetical protein